MTSRNPIENLGQSLGEYLREQRTAARLSLRQLADVAGVSNPYLSQIERGIKKPSADILQQLAKGLQISSESLYVKAGFLDEQAVSEHRPWDVEVAVTADAALTARQKDTLIDIYRSFVGDPASDPSAVTQSAPTMAASKKSAVKPSPTRATTTKTTTKKNTAKKATARKATRGTKASPAQSTTQTTNTKE